MSDDSMKGSLFIYKDNRNLFLKPVGEVSFELIESLSFYAEQIPELKEFLYIDFSECLAMDDVFEGMLCKLAVDAHQNSISVIIANTQEPVQKDFKSLGLGGLVDFKEMDLSMIPWESFDSSQS